jgi:hypothetical protein
MVEDTLTSADFQAVDIGGDGKFTFTNCLRDLRRSLKGVSNKIIPVVVLNDIDNPGAVQPTLPKPSNKQTLKRYHIYQAASTSSRYVNVATADSTKKLSFLGVCWSLYDTAGRTVSIFDAASGSAPYATDGDTTNIIVANSTASTYFNGQWFPPLPIAITAAIRVQVDTTSASSYINIDVYYMEETY